MLRELSVQKLALIDDIRVELEPGFCAWTGETGAGKTLLLQALGLLMGDRGSAELLRAGADELRIVGRFDLTKPVLRQAVEKILQAPLEDSEILLLRRLTSQGRSYAYVNDQPVTLTTLKQLGNLLVDIHGQRESQALLDSTFQLLQLDAFGELDSLREEYQQSANKVRDLRKKLAQLEADRQNRLRELSLLAFEKEELERANLVAGEMEGLSKEREKLMHAQSLIDFAQSASDRLYDEEGSLFEALGKIQRDAAHWAKIDPELVSISQRLDGLASETQDLAQSLRPWTQKSQADPARQDEVENRIQLLRRLETKYGKTLGQLIAYRETLDAQEAKLTGAEEDRSALELDLQKSFQTLKESANKLTKERQKSAKKLGQKVEKELADLGMPDAQLEACLEKIPVGDDPRASEVPANGFEHLELMLAANKGEPGRPLRKVASGGEMSRTMLALKSVLAEQDQVGTMIFDEIDANVGGRLGDVLGAKLAGLAQSHQVICVTHLPQVASYARNHWTIRKTKKGNRTETTISPLGENDRLEELASMLRGASRGETTLKEAEAMLNAARKKWPKKK